MRVDVGGGITAAVLLTLVVCSIVGPLSATAAARDHSTMANRGGEIYSSQEVPLEQVAAPENETNATAVRHENPASADERSDLTGVTRTLAEAMTGRLASSTIELSRGQYEQARSLIGDEYDNQLSKYVDVSGLADTEVNGQTFRNAQTNQQQFVDETQEYWTTYENYREAKRAGDEQRARRLARQLDETARNVSQAGDRLEGNLQAISSQTGSDLNDSIDGVRRIRQEVEREQTAIVETEFVETRLAIETNDTRISFVEPLSLRGRVRVDNGSTLTDRTVRIRVTNQTYEVETDARGEFRLQYRPTSVSVQRRNLTVEYLPQAASVYRRSNATVPVRIQQVTPTVSITEAPSRTRYRETVIVRGRVAVGGYPPSDVPVAVSLGGTSLGTAETDDSGTFTVRRALPAQVTAGQRNLTATVTLTDRALARAASTESMQVAQTETNLSASLARDDDAVQVSGRLTTTDGMPVPDQRVTFQIADTRITEARTGPRGNYEVTVPEPVLQREADENGTVRLAVSYDGAGTSLASTRVSRSISISVGGTPGTGGMVSSWLELFLGNVEFGLVPMGGQGGRTAIAAGMLIIATLVGGTFYVGLRQVRSPEAYSEDVTTAVGPAGEIKRTHVSGGPTLDVAEEHLAKDDTDAAVITAYLVARDALAQSYQVSNRTTHWAFYRSLRTQTDADDTVASDDEASTFRRLVTWYEYAAFAPDETPPGRAEKAIEAARQLVDSQSADGSTNDSS